MDINNRRNKSTPELAIIRFWDKVDKKGNDECWNWKASTSSTGYGVLTINRKIIKAHRFSYELHFGKINDGLYVLHKCDNILCVNPNHLFVGTQKDNIQDMKIKGRHGSITHPEIFKETARLARKYKNLNINHN